MSLVGRQSELAELATLLEMRALITILGPPGVGKTRLAVEIGRRHRERFAGGVWFCDLTEASLPEEICTRVAHALDVPVHSADRTVAQLGTALATRERALLVLDNFEQVTAHAEATVGAWLAAAPEARVLVTSRERLKLPGEVLFELGPLSLPEPGSDLEGSDAARLFIERTRAVRRGFDPRDGEADAVRSLVRALDGLPLAIELAAARMRVVTAAQLCELLSRRFEVLVGGPGRGGGPQASLRGAIEASWTLLSAWERSALAQLSVFRGGFRFEAAAAVLDLSAHLPRPTVLDALQALCERSLLRAEPDSAHPDELRYALYLTIREFASERLEESGEAEATIARHAEHATREGLALGSAALRLGDVGASRRLEREIENLTAVHHRATRGAPSAEKVRWALAAGVAVDAALQRAGPWERREPVLDSALAFAERAGERWDARHAAAEAYLARGKIRSFRGSLGRSADDYRRAKELGEALGDGDLVARADDGLGVVAALERRCEVARTHHEDALAYARRAGDRALEGLVLGHLGSAYLFEGRLDEAEQRYEASLGIHRELGNVRLVGLTLDYLANVLQERGRLGDARALFEQGLALQREIGNRTAEAEALGSLGEIAQEQGDLASARELLEKTVSILRSLGNRRWEGQWLGALAACVEEAGDLPAAAGIYERALAAHREVGDRAHEALTLCSVARGAADGGDAVRALALVDAAAELWRSVGEVRLTPMLAIVAGHVALDRARAAQTAGDGDTASSAIAEARDVVARARTARDGAQASPPVRVRTALRLLERSLGEVATASGEPLRPAPLPSPEPLVVGREGRWFQSPRCALVRLDRRPSLRRVLCALVERRDDAPGEALALPILWKRAWPDERLSLEVGRKRVHTALWTLRKLGLASVLLSRDDGYLLDPGVPLRVLDSL